MSEMPMSKDTSSSERWLANRRVFSVITVALFIAGFALTGISPTVSAALGVWGFVALFTHIATTGLYSHDAEWVEARGLLKFGVILLVGGAVSITGAAVAHSIGQSNLTVSLYDAIGGNMSDFGVRVRDLLFSRRPAGVTT